MKIQYLFFAVLIIFNIVCLYLILDLSSYDGMVSYLKNGHEKYTSIRYSAIVFLITCLANLLFISASLMKRIIFSQNQPRSGMRF